MTGVRAEITGMSWSSGLCACACVCVSVAESLNEIGWGGGREPRVTPCGVTTCRGLPWELEWKVALVTVLVAVAKCLLD